MIGITWLVNGFMRYTLFFAAGCCFAVTINNASAATITIYDGVGAGQLRSDWETAVGSFAEEDFSDGLWQGVTATAIGGGHGSFGVSSSKFNDRLVPANSTELVFNTAITAFGADWDLFPGGAGLGVVIDAGGTIVPVEIPNTHVGEFFGFTSDMAFTKIVLTSGSQDLFAETYNLDNAVTPVVPEPASLALLNMGGLALFGYGWRRRRKTQLSA